MERTEVEWPHEHRRGNWFLYSKLGFEFTGQDPPSQDAVATWERGEGVQFLPRGAVFNRCIP